MYLNSVALKMNVLSYSVISLMSERSLNDKRWWFKITAKQCSFKRVVIKADNRVLINLSITKTCDHNTKI